MWYSLKRIPLPLLLALAVVVGVTVTIIIQVTVLAPIPAVVAPIETPAQALETGQATYTISIDVAYDDYAIYPTLAGLGKLKIEATTNGWYYIDNDWIVTVVRRGTGDIELTIPGSNLRVFVKEVDNERAIVLYERYYSAVVAKKVQLGSVGWYVYHPIYVSSYDSTLRNVIFELMNDLGLYRMYIFQPSRDYVEFDPDTRTFTVYVDEVNANNQEITRRVSFFTVPISTFNSIQPNQAITIDGAIRINTYNYVIYPTWLLLYHKFTQNTETRVSITPVA